MSLIFAGGNHATALANITSAINARIVTLADGTKDLNRESLVAWALDQFALMITDNEALDIGYNAALDPRPAVKTLSDVVGPWHWQNRPDWPVWSPTQNEASGQQVSGVAAQQATLKRASEAVSAVYAFTQDDFYGAIQQYVSGNVEPTVPAGVDILKENRVYVATYVTDRGEESAPSPASDLIELDQNDTTTITVPSAPGGRHITHFRLYRSNSNNSGSAFQYVPNAADDDGWPIGTLTITDDKKAEELQEPLETLLWDEPPEDLQGLVGGANGGMAGFRGNEFCPCIPYKGYAFPVSLRITTESPIVGLAASGDSYFVGTRGLPYIITGTDTTTLSPRKLDEAQACVSRRSIVAMAGGFIYASPDGLCMVDAGGVKILTGTKGFNLFDRTKWQELNPSSIFAAQSEGCYVFHWSSGGDSGMYSLDVVNGKLVTLSNAGSALYRDDITDTLYIATGTQIKAIGGGTGKRSAVWKSKRIVLPREVSFAWVQANSDYEDDVTVRTYADGELVDTTVLSDLDPQRFVEGLAQEWELEVESAARVTSVLLAESTEELKSL
jgi:hypothetical protein